MDDEKKISIEVKAPGVSELSEVATKSINFTIDALKVFLNVTCKPALEELGYLLADKIHVYRVNNLLKWAEKTNQKIKLKNIDLNRSVNSKVALGILENVCNEESDELQELWAALYVNSLLEDPTDDENIIYVDILKKISTTQLRLLLYSYNKDGVHNGGASDEELKIIMKTNDLERIKRDLYYLRTYKLIAQGGNFMYQGANVSEIEDHSTNRIFPTIILKTLMNKCTV